MHSHSILLKTGDPDNENSDWEHGFDNPRYDQVKSIKAISTQTRSQVSQCQMECLSLKRKAKPIALVMYVHKISSTMESPGLWFHFTVFHKGKQIVPLIFKSNMYGSVFVCTVLFVRGILIQDLSIVRIYRTVMSHVFLCL